VRLPSGLTTGIGSLPHADASAAAETVLSGAVDIPFWPQLPKRDFREWMVPQYAADLPGFVLEEEARRFRVERADGFVDELTAFYERVLDPGAEFPLREDFAAGWFAFLKHLWATSPRPDFLKGQVTGPLTFVLGINLADGRPIHADEELRQAGVTLLARNAAWQARRLGELAGQGALVFMDEPIYSALGTPAYLSVTSEGMRSAVNEVAAAVRDAGALVGLHCCGNADWETVLSTDIDVLSFDAWEYAPRLAIYPAALGAFLERGGVLAWGIVPTGEAIGPADADAVKRRLDEGLAAFEGRGVPAARLRSQALLTPSCGCGSRTVEETAKVFDLLGAVGRHWKAAVREPR